MPAPYSYDLRTKAIEAVKRGEKKIHVSRFFKISRNTLDLWLKKERETGDYKASLPVGRGTPPQIQELEKFREFVTEHSDLTQKQIAELWEHDATQQNISYADRKLGITRKKKTYGYSERDEEKRCSAVLGRQCGECSAVSAVASLGVTPTRGNCRTRSVLGFPQVEQLPYAKRLGVTPTRGNCRGFPHSLLHQDKEKNLLKN